MTTEEKRALVYKALCKCCWRRVASLEEIAEALEYEEPLLRKYIDGLVALKELEYTTVHVVKEAAGIDDGFSKSTFGFDEEACTALVESQEGYRLTDAGQGWVAMFTVSCPK